MQEPITETYEISSPEDLLDYKNKLEQRYFLPKDSIAVLKTNYVQRVIEWKLTRDIDMTGTEWSPITTISHKFNVTTVLDGCGHSIKGLYSCPKICHGTRYEFVPPCAAANANLFMQPAGLLFLSQHNALIRNLTVQGTLDLRGIQKDSYMRVSAGGISGILGPKSSVSNCRAKTEVILPEEECIRRGLRCGGIAGANQGEIVNCVYSGNLTQGLQDVRTAGIAVYNSGFIKDSYTEQGSCPAVYDKTYDISKNGLWRLRAEQGIVDNIGLYLPGEPYYTGCFEDFFGSETLRKLVRWDTLRGGTLDWMYLEKTATEEIVRVVEASAAEGAKFGVGDTGAAALSVSPFRDFSSKRSLKGDMKLCISKYSLMLDRLVTESPAFRKAILFEWRRDPDVVFGTISEYVTSRKRVESIFRKAEKYQDYSQSVEADNEFIDWVYDR